MEKDDDATSSRRRQREEQTYITDVGLDIHKLAANQPSGEVMISDTKRFVREAYKHEAHPRSLGHPIDPN